MKRHEIKCWPQFFRDLITGDKPFEVRYDDRDYCKGDTLYVREWSPTLETYSGAFLTMLVTYVLPGGQYGIEPGYVVMGVRRISDQ